MWEDLSDRLRITVQFAREPLPPPSNEALDAFESRRQFTLPPSYRQFVERFGAGYLAGLYYIAAPGGDTSRSDLEQLDDFVHSFVKPTDAAVLHRCLYFCSTIGGDDIGWDPMDREGPAAEYGIYARLHVAPDRAVKVASSFTEFIRSVCLGPGHRDLYLGTPEFKFERAGKQPPTSATESPQLPDDKSQLFNEGTEALRRGQFEVAIEKLSKVIALEPTDAAALESRASAFVECGNIDAAIADYSQAVDVEDEESQLRWDRGKLYESQGRLDEALRDYTDALALWLKHKMFLFFPSAIYSDRGRMLEKLGQYREAILNYEQCIASDRRGIGCDLNLARLLACCPDLSYRDLPRAITIAKTACEKGNWRVPPSLDLLAAVYVTAGMKDEAVKLARSAVEFATDREKDLYRNRLKHYEQGQAVFDELEL